MPPRKSKSENTQKITTPVKKKKGPSRRKLLYKAIEVRKCWGKDALTAEDAKQLLGWQTESKSGEFAGEYFLQDANGHKVRLHNNTQNRPYYHQNTLALKQEILRKRFAGPNGIGSTINGETLIIGRTGLTVSAQHRLVALVLAVQEWEANSEEYPAWKTAPVMDTIIVLGVDEDDDTINTIDTGKPRSLKDVIYRSEYFRDLPTGDRKRIASMLQHAVRLLWDRTGIADALSLMRTHAEALNFIDNHQRVIQCVKHVFEENVNNRIGRVISLGYAAALMYLMGCCRSEPAKYTKQNPRTEQPLDWSAWDDASAFWVTLGQGEQFSTFNRVWQRMLNDGDTSVAERCALVVKAWNAHLAGKPINSKSLNLKYQVNEEEGIRALIECPTVGGIDFGVEPAVEEEIPTPEEIDQRAADQRNAARTKKQSR